MSKTVIEKIIDDNVRQTFESEEEMLDFLIELTSSTTKVHKNLSSLSVVYEQNGSGMFADDVAKSFGLEDLPKEAITSTLSRKGSQMILVEKVDGEEKSFLLSKYGFQTLIAAIDADTKGFKNLPLEDQALIANIYAKNTPSTRTGNFLMRGHKVRAVRGETFADLNQDMLFKSLMGLIHGEFGGGKFLKGTFEHSLTKAMWKLPNSTEMLSEYNEKIKKAKSLYKTRVFVPAVEFSTSDVGVCSATITIALVDDVDGYELVLSSPIRIEHRSGKELSDFEDSLDDVSDQLQDSIDAMSKMLDIEIADVVETAHIMIKKDITRIGLRPLTKAVQKLYDQNGGEKVYKGTAHDVFLLLHDAFSIMRNEGRKMNQKTLELVGNNIAKLVSPNFKWDKYSVNKTKK